MEATKHDDFRSKKTAKRLEELRARGEELYPTGRDHWLATHDCMDYAQTYSSSDGPLGHGWECGRCGAFLQAG
jgi:hypothetical protein